MADRGSSLPKTIAQLVSALSGYFADAAAIAFSMRNAPTGSGVVRDGLGWLAPGLSIAQGSTITVTYNFGRVPIFVQLLDNGTTAQTRLQVTARSATAVTFKPLDAALTGALVRIQ